MKTWIKSTVTFVYALIFIGFTHWAWSTERHAHSLCNDTGYHCIKIKRGETWASIWPDGEQRDIIKRLNRMNIRLRAGMKIAVPNNLSELTVYDVAPFPRYVEPTGEKTIHINQDHLAWAAYNAKGQLVWWGPMSTGKDFCQDVGRGCRTPTGSFRIIRKQGINCISSKFPKRRYGRDGGAPMPYCMHFYRGYALHGSFTVPGHRDSHGCIRLFTEDAKWLNKEFIDLPKKGQKGTLVIIDKHKV